jgi:hypothetical protein
MQSSARLPVPSPVWNLAQWDRFRSGQELAMQVDGPDAWMAAMKRGDFAQAWTISDRILARRISQDDFDYTLPRHMQSIWDGRPLKDKHVLIRCYHGLGDTVQFIRFAKPLRAFAREISVWAQPSLLPLVKDVEGVDRVLPLHDGTPDLAYDADIEVMELAYALRTVPPALAHDVPYIRPPRRNLDIPESGRLRVGLIWATGTWEPERSLRFSALKPLLDVSDVMPIALQCGDAAEQARTFAVRDCGNDDVQLFAAMLGALDVLISVDTFGAHLAGAMNVPVWVMLKYDCDWRWMSTGRTSPWYPSMRLYRQPAPGDWASVIGDVARDLACEAARRNIARQEQTHLCDVRTV